MVRATGKRDVTITNRGWKMPRHRLGIAPMTTAERLRRHRARLEQHSRTIPTSPGPRIPARPVGGGGDGARQSAGRIPRLAGQPPGNLEASRLAEKLQTIIELDLVELQTMTRPAVTARLTQEILDRHHPTMIKLLNLKYTTIFTNPIHLYDKFSYRPQIGCRR
jgi:hypothetical protein